MYRLAVFPISLPTLRERGDDVILLAGQFLSLHNKANKTEKRLTERAHERLLAYDWPGNVRQLRNMIQRAYILEGSAVDMDCLVDLLDETEPATCDAAVNTKDEAGGCQDGSRGAAAAQHASDSAPHHKAEQAEQTEEPAPADDAPVVELEVGATIEEAEKKLILKTLEDLDGNKTEAAKVLGISVKTLYNRLNSYE